MEPQPWVPLLVLSQFCFCFTQPICCSSSTLGIGRNLLQTGSPPATNVQTFFPSNALPALADASSSPSPSPAPGPATSPTSPPEGCGGGCDSRGAVLKAVLVTFFATLAVSCAVFFAFCKLERKCRRKGDQNASDAGGGRRRVDGEDDVNGVNAVNNALDVVYVRNMYGGGAIVCSNCKAALSHTASANYPHQTESDEGDEDFEQHSGGHGGGRRGGRRRRRKDQATPLLPVGSLRSSDREQPVYSTSSTARQSRPFPPLPSLQASTHERNGTSPQNLPPPPPLVMKAEAVAAPHTPPPLRRPSTAESSSPTQPSRSDVAAPSPPPPPKGGSPPPPPPPVIPKRAGPPPPPPPGSKKGPPAPPPPAPGGRTGTATPRVPSEGSPTKRAQLPPPAKLKPLHWDKMTTANVEHSMVWDKIPSDGSFRFDDDVMVALFGTAAISRNANDTSAHNRKDSGDSGRAGGQTSQQQQIVLLDPRKSQNIAIVIRSLAIGRQTVIDALLDGHGLASDVLEKLFNAPRPTKDEEGLVLGFSDDPSKLADAEAFLYQLLRSVPAPFDRLEAMLFRSTFNQELAHITESLLVLESACKVIKGSTVFPKLLAAVLKAGNRMNAGTARGDAKAFNLTSLRKLSDVRSTNGKTTLLHFLVEEVIRAEGKRCVVNRTIDTTTISSSSKDEKEMEYMMLGLPVIGGLSSEFDSVKKAALIDHDSLVATCTVLETKVKGVARTAKAAAVGEFQKEMRGFLESSEKELIILRAQKQMALDLVNRTTEYYVVGASKDRNFKPLQLFVIVKDFVTMVDQVCVDVTRNLQQRQQQLRKMKRLRQQQEQKQQQQEGEQANITPESSSATETTLDQSTLDSGRMSSPVTFPNFPTHFLRRSSSDSGSDSDEFFAS